MLNAPVSIEKVPDGAFVVLCVFKNSE